MAGWILNIAYIGLILCVSPGLLWKYWRYGKYTAGWTEKLWGQLPVNNRQAPLIWLHAVSVGEVLLLRPLVARLQKARPDCRVLISTTTQSGFRVLKEKYPDCQAAYFPLDFTWSVSTALKRVQPDLVVLTELEIWPNFLRVLQQHQIPVCLINGRLGQRSFRGYRWVKFLFRPLLSSLNAVAVQTSEYAGRFMALGVPENRIHITGSIKFDGVQTRRDNAATASLRQLFQLDRNSPVWVAGSTQSPEEQIVLHTYSRLKHVIPNLRLILVPRHPERGSEIASRIRSSGFSVWQRSHMSQLTAPLSNESVILLDTVGELGACWGLADVAYVGGSLGNRGGQNMLEPAAYGAAVCFGPNTWNFRHVVEMLMARDGATVVRNEEELFQCVAMLLQNPELARSKGARARELVLSQAGATDRTLELILAALPPPAHTQRRVA